MRIACARAIGQPRGHELKIIKQPRKKSQQGYEETSPHSPFQGKAGIRKLCLYARNDHTKHSPNVHTLQAEIEGIRHKLPSCVICLASGARKERNTIPYEHLVGNKESRGIPIKENGACRPTCRSYTTEAPTIPSHRCRKHMERTHSQYANLKTFVKPQSACKSKLGSYTR